MLHFSRPARLTLLMLPILIGVNAANATIDSKVYKNVIESSKSSLVTIKYVAKFETPQGPQDVEREINALAIDNKGLIVCSSLQLGTSRYLRVVNAMVTPSDIKVLYGEDTVGVEAELIATDAELDLSWLRIKDFDKMKDKPGFVDFDNAAKAELGSEILVVARLHKYYGRAIVLSEGRVAGQVEKPREMWVGRSGVDQEPGMPVFGADGKPVGLVTFQVPDPDDFSPREMREAQQTLILDAATVAKATKRALEEAAAAAEEEE